MRSGPGAVDSNGVYQFGEADNPDGSFSGLMALLTSPLSTLLGTISASLSKKGRIGTARGTVLNAAPATLVGGTLTDVATVAGTSHGGVCTAEVSVVVNNLNSGSARVVGVRVEVDGVSIGSVDFTVQTVSGQQSALTAVYTFDSTPPAGAHTWKLRISTPSSSTVNYYAGVLAVREG